MEITIGPMEVGAAMIAFGIIMTVAWFRRNTW